MFEFLNHGLFRYLFLQNTFTAYSWQFYAFYIGFIVISLVLAYLLGSINSAILISKVLYHDDIRKHGSGNAGTTNMLRTYGKGAAGLTLLGDMLKTVIAIFIAGTLHGFGYVNGVSCNEGWCYMAGLFAVLGHIFPIYYGGKGGKGVLVTATMALMLTPLLFTILLLIFILIVAVTKYVSLGSVTGAIFYPVIVNGYFMIYGIRPHFILILCTILVAILIFWCHKENLKRIGERTERKISFKKKDVEVTSRPKKDISADED